MPASSALRIGVISDTHGLLRAEAKTFLNGCDHIVHAGDIGHAGILDELATLAPVTAVRGNNDRGAWAERIRDTEMIELEGVRIYVVHDLAQLDVEPVAERIRVVVSGHSHKPAVLERNGVLFVNPGSAGPRRFTLPVSVAELNVAGNSVRARTIELDIRREK